MPIIVNNICLSVTEWNLYARIISFFLSIIFVYVIIKLYYSIILKKKGLAGIILKINPLTILKAITITLLVILCSFVLYSVIVKKPPSFITIYTTSQSEIIILNLPPEFLANYSSKRGKALWESAITDCLEEQATKFIAKAEPVKEAHSSIVNFSFFYKIDFYKNGQWEPNKTLDFYDSKPFFMIGRFLFLNSSNPSFCSFTYNGILYHLNVKEQNTNIARNYSNFIVEINNVTTQYESIKK